MNLSKTFIEDEVRLGFYIPATIKQAWAAELEVLHTIDRICQENSIRYYADWGTFLGAVRHGGFIPWDDDLDIVMLREDYDRFLSISANVLPEGYAVHTFRNEDGFVEFHAVVMNTERARFDEEHHKKFHGFPYICGIDIFVLDFVHNDDMIETKRCKDVTYIIAFADGMLCGSFDQASINHNLDKIEVICHTKIDRNLSTKALWVKLYELAERKCAEVTSNDSNTLAQLVPWGLKGQKFRRYLLDDYNNIVRLSFENTTIPVPLYYDRLLGQRYSNYMRINKNAGAHDYPYFTKQKSDLEALLGYKLNHYDYPGLQKRSSLSNTWKDTIQECLDNLETLYSQLLRTDDTLIDAICDSQELSIELGNFIESIKGSENEALHTIEEYCEKLYSLCSFVSGEDTTEYEDEIAASQALIDSVITSYSQMISSIKEVVLNRKEIVFLPFKPDYWNSFDAIYRQYMNSDDYDIYVVPVPYYYKNFDGTLSDEQYCMSGYPEHVRLTRFNEFSLEFHHPDTIYIQSPYDQYNSATSIHPDYYSSVIYEYTNKLIYIPWFRTYIFDKSDVRAYKNMNYYVCQPGIVYADEIILEDDKLKNTYIDKLCEWGGESTRNMWFEKISILKYNVSAESEPESKKSILYYIGQGQPLQNIDNFINKLKTNLAIFKEQKDRLFLVLYPDSKLADNIKNYSENIYYEYLEILEEFNHSDYGVIYSGQVCDAFYGDTSPIATEYSYLGKPVMIQNYEV